MAFSNPIVGGNDTLIRDKIQSEGYVTATTGWRIDRDGDAEFNDVDVRGDIIVDDGQHSIEIGTPGSLAQILFGVSGVDVGRIYIDGALSPPALAIEGLFGGLAEAVIRFNPASGFVVLGAGADAFYVSSAETFRTSQYIEYAPTVGGANPRSVWTNVPALQNSWVADTSPPQYKKQPDGTIRFRGWIKNGITALTTTLFTMPVGARPSSDVYFKVAKPNDAGATAPTIDITPAGVVRLIHIGTSVTASLSLDNVSYSTL